ncbi:MAG: PhzF family phenazine biosynthesis protein [Actinobacteria bacterium]|nr:MAG: PhzF family phenazine biosynthesis protein [Actinomycetota bacterium]
MGQTIVTVDAFTDRPFAGNPAAVCVLDAYPDDAWMQAVAREMNLSETAFVVHRGDGDWDLRWFSPTVEVDICGHATLSAAHVLWQDGLAPATDALRFRTRSGVLGAEPDGDWIELDFPAAPADDPLVEVRELPSEDQLRAFKPDMAELEEATARVVYYTAPGNDGFDYADRVFGPKVGIPEDPATGSAHCTLAPLWAARLGKDQMMARQVSARGGVFKVRVAGDRVKIAGQAVTVLRAQLAAARAPGSQ